MKSYPYQAKSAAVGVLYNAFGEPYATGEDRKLSGSEDIAC
jgi:hypothetical protein